MTNTSSASNRALLLFLLALVSYLVINTGIISDDFVAIQKLKGENFINIIIPTGVFYFIETPVEYFTHYIWYNLAGIDDQAVINIFKALYILLSLYLISRFFSIYMERQAALLVSFLFIFFPSHDSTVYAFMLQYLMLSFAFYLYAFYLAHRGRLAFAFLFALLGSFISYGSPAIALALFVLFLLYKEVKKALVLLMPNILYVIYYITISKVAVVGVDKMARGMDISALTKSLVVQVVTFGDAMIGPSMWLKIYYSFFQLSVLSLLIGALLVIIFYKKYKESKRRYEPRLVICLVILTILSLGMFAMTGKYPQLAFNLGNRVTIFGSLLFAYIIVLLPVSHKIRTVIFALIIFSVLGISDHWKNWNLEQEKVIENMRNNQNLKNYTGEAPIYVSGNQYSLFGPISHIEFLSEGWVPSSIYQIIYGKKKDVLPLNKRYGYDGGDLVDLKYGRKYPVKGHITVYDSANNTLIKVDAGEINAYIDSLPPDNRHWVQMINNRPVKNIITRLMPDVKYGLD